MKRFRIVFECADADGEIHRGEYYSHAPNQDSALSMFNEYPLDASVLSVDELPPPSSRPENSFE